jgi:soluble lytic murein transglycosylase
MPGRITLSRRCFLALASSIWLGLLPGLLLAGEIYYYVDENGVYHFSDRRKTPEFDKVMVWKEGDYEAEVFELDPLYQELISRACATYAVEEALVLAMVRVESNFDKDAISRKGAQGLLQLMPETAQRYRVRNTFNPRENIYAGVLHLKTLLMKYKNDEKLALAAYNAGAGAVDKYRGIPPFPETQNYVRLVLKYRDLYREQAKNSNGETQTATGTAHD